MNRPLQKVEEASFHAQTRTARKILVVDLGFLGDSVHLIPALWEIKRHHAPGALHVLTSTIGAEVLGLAPCVDRAWAVELYPQQRTLRQQWKVVRALRRERFDLAFNFSGADRTILMTALVTGLGLMPLVIGSGEPGREIEGPMAAVIVGGLATSTLLNLLVLPTLLLHYGRFEPKDQESRAATSR